MPKKQPAGKSKPAAVAPETPPRLLPEQWLALNRATSDKLIKAARSELKPGQAYDVDFGVRVTGQVLVGFDNAFTTNQAPKLLDLVQALLAQYGPRKRRAVVQELITAGIAKTIAPDEQPIEGLADLAQHLVDGLTTTTKSTRRGNVTGDIDVQLVQWS